MYKLILHVTLVKKKPGKWLRTYTRKDFLVRKWKEDIVTNKIGHRSAGPVHTRMVHYPVTFKTISAM